MSTHDPDPRPRYGEYATPEEQRARMQPPAGVEVPDIAGGHEAVDDVLAAAPDHAGARRAVTCRLVFRSTTVDDALCGNA